MDCLRVVVERHRQSELSSDADAMQVDSTLPTSDIPALPPFLASCVMYATTPSALRAAMRRSLKDPDDLLTVIKILEMWINRWSKRDIRLLPPKKEVSKNEHGVQVVKEKRKEVNKDSPPLDKVGLFPTTYLFCIIHLILYHPYAGPGIPPDRPRRLFCHSSPAHAGTTHLADALCSPWA